jgi:16S rRNA (cytidine1402-2'-O)-methyltransferase
MNQGKLYLIPTPINGIDFKSALTSNDIDTVSRLEHFIVETPKTARSYLGTIDLKTPIQEIDIRVFDEHSNLENIQELIQPLLAGQDMGLMTDAGTPCIADPGEEIVLMCHRLDIEIVPMVGPSSIFLSLMASGLDAENFTFNGYLPRKPNKRVKELKKLEKRVTNNRGSQIFIEAPYRNQVMFDDIMKLDENIYLCIGENIGAENSKIETKPIVEWKKKGKNLEKVPIIYILGRGYEKD